MVASLGFRCKGRPCLHPEGYQAKGGEAERVREEGEMIVSLQAASPAPQAANGSLSGLRAGAWPRMSSSVV